MRKAVFLLLSVFSFTFFTPTFADTDEGHEAHQTEHAHDGHEHDHDHEAEAHGEEHEEAHGSGLMGWEVIPFISLLLMIATGPLFFEHFWHKNYPIIAITLAAMVVGYYIFVLHHGYHHVVHSLAEYFQFISLLAALFMSAGGILIKVDKEGKPLVNVMLLIIGSVLANVIGTTGASMLLIRPFIKLNKDRIKAYHIVFFIFMVSNVGGALTPIGDPPLFLGFLKGVPFEWTITHDFVPWVFAIALLATVFVFIDSKNKSDKGSVEYTGKVTIKGASNFLFIAVIIAAVFIDPNVFGWVPGILFGHDGELMIGFIANQADASHWHVFSFIREIIMLTVGFLSFKFASKEALKGNEFDFEPIKEVAFIFIGIFFTMMPALQLVSDFAKSPSGIALLNTHSLYWLTGALSGVLDNAPTYLNFFAAAFSADAINAASVATQQGNEVLAMEMSNLAMNPANVKDYANGREGFELLNGQTVIHLTAISCASVFFGAMTYIGNAPNFMVKSIAEQCGVKMPSFVAYFVRYAAVILLPILFLVWVIFFGLDVISLIVL